MSQKYTRKEWNKLAVTGLAGMFVPSIFTSCAASSVIPASLKDTAAAADAKALGIVLGVQT